MNARTALRVFTAVSLSFMGAAIAQTAQHDVPSQSNIAVVANRITLPVDETKLVHCEAIRTRWRGPSSTWAWSTRSCRWSAWPASPAQPGTGSRAGSVHGPAVGPSVCRFSPLARTRRVRPDCMDPQKRI